jgi:hypothetical protein
MLNMSPSLVTHFLLFPFTIQHDHNLIAVITKHMIEITLYLCK